MSQPDVFLPLTINCEKCGKHFPLDSEYSEQHETEHKQVFSDFEWIIL